MDILLNIMLALALALVVYQDIKMRAIHVLLPIAILILGVVLNWETMDIDEIGMSIFFLALNFSVMTLYFSIKNRRLTNAFDSMIGWGDVAFLIALVPLFSFQDYVLFFVLGMIFSLMLYGIMGRMYKVEKTIPLAGYLSIFVLATMGVGIFGDTNFLTTVPF